MYIHPWAETSNDFEIKIIPRRRKLQPREAFTSPYLTYLPGPQEYVKQWPKTFTEEPKYFWGSGSTWQRGFLESRESDGTQNIMSRPGSCHMASFTARQDATPDVQPKLETAAARK